MREIVKEVGLAWCGEAKRGYTWNPIREAGKGIGLCTVETGKGFGHMSNRDFIVYPVLFGTTPGGLRSLGNAEEATRPPDLSGVRHGRKVVDRDRSSQAEWSHPPRLEPSGWRGRCRHCRPSWREWNSAEEPIGVTQC